MAYVLFLFVSLIWGASFILMKKADLCYGPLSIGGWRSVAGAAVLLAAWIIRDRKWHFKRKHALPFAVLVLTSYLWPYTAQPYFIRHFAQSAIVGQSIAFVPLFTVIASVPLLKKWPTRRQWIGVIIGLICYLVIMADSVDRNLDLSHVALLLTVPASYAVGNTVNKRFLSDVSPVFLAGMCMTVNSILIVPFAVAREPIVVREGFSGATIALVILGTIGTGAAMAAFYRVIHQRGPLFAGMVGYLIPIGALLWGGIDGEAISLIQGLAVVGTLVGVAIAQYQPEPPENASSPETLS